MFCAQCGSRSDGNAHFCQQCGHSLSGAVRQPTENVSFYDSRHAIWNPYATANWSIVFTPAFGSYLQMRNWKTLGEHDKAASAENWFNISLGMLLAYVLIAWIMARSAVEGIENAVSGLALLFLFAWYFSSGINQCKYVKEKFGTSYARKAWGKPLFLSTAALIGYWIVAPVASFMLSRVWPT